MNAYMVFGLGAGSEEGAALVFAHTAREAKVVGWRNGIVQDIAYEFTNVGVRLLRDHGWLFSEADPQKLKDDVAHVIEEPKCCVACRMWGMSPIGEDKVCEGCREDADDEQRMKEAIEAGDI